MPHYGPMEKASVKEAIEAAEARGEVVVQVIEESDSHASLVTRPAPKDDGYKLRVQDLEHRSTPLGGQR